MLLLAAAILALLPQRFVSNDALQPRTYTSPSGEWTVSVDPSARDGAGKSTVRIAKQGKTQWTGEKPFTFRDAVIDDTGICAGYAYTQGKEGREEAGALLFALIGTGGETLLVDETPRESRDSSHMPPHPSAMQILLHPGLKSVVLRLDQPDANDFSECWFVYSVSPPKKLEVVRGERELAASDQQVFAFAIDAIRGTPLTLAHWHTPGQWDSPGAGSGSEFALYDESWKLVWSLPLPGDMELEDRDAERQLFMEIRDQGAILDTRHERRFELRHIAKSERVTYEVARDPAAKTGWSVTEVARAPFVGTTVEVPREPTKLSLPLVASTALDVAPVPSGPIRDIEAFVPDAAGGFTFVRGEELRHAVTLVTISASGAVLRQVAIAPIEPDAEGARTWFPLLDGEWMMTLSPWEGDRRSRAWRINAATGAATELTEFSGPAIESVVPTSDGGFVVLGTHRLEYTSQDEVRRCARNGKTLWSHRTTGYGQCESAPDLCSPVAIAVRKDDAVLVLDGYRTLLQVFDPAGAYVSSLPFANSWDTDSSYLTSLLLDPSGNYLVGDHHDERCLRRVRPDGQQATALQFRLENGSRDAVLPMCVDDQGRLWGSDGHQILEYGEDGIVRARFGTPIDPARLGAEIDVHFDRSGRIALVDNRTHAVHVFSSDGRRSLVCVPDSTDFDDESSTVDEVLTDADGTIYVQPNSLVDSFLAFGSDGRRLGRVELGGTQVAFNKRTRQRWAAGEAKDDTILLRCFGPDHKLEFETDRRPDGTFFEGIKALAVGPDNSVAVLDGPDLWSRVGNNTVSIFGSKGEPRRVIELPADDLGANSNMQFGRRWIVISGYYPTARLISLVDGTLTLFDAADPSKDNRVWALSLSTDEKELWAMENSPPKLHRYSLPR